MNDKKHTTLSIWLPNKEADWFKRMAEMKNMSISVFLNEVLDEYKRRYTTNVNMRLEQEQEHDICFENVGKDLTFFF